MVYRRRGAVNFCPADAVLSLSEGRYSHGLAKPVLQPGSLWSWVAGLALVVAGTGAVLVASSSVGPAEPVPGIECGLEEERRAGG
jgi:hypothetical protein